MKARRSLIVISLLALSLTAVGESQWIAINKSTETSYNKKADSDVTIVAYTRTNNVNTYYLSIEKALEQTTSGTVYVVPGTNPTITRNCEIKSGVTLCIPYDDNGDGTHSDYTSLKNQSNDGFADKDATAVAKYRKNVVTIAAGITLTNNGTIDVAGKVGVGNSNQRPTGFTMGDYCEILMKDNAKIKNNGTINLYGYIKEDSKNNGSVVENSSTGSMKMPLVIYDFKGGSYASACKNKGTLGFSYFDFPNCHVLQNYIYGSKLTGLAVLYAVSSYNSATALVLGTDNENCLFKMSQGSKVVIKYLSSDYRYTTVDVSKNVTEATANYTHINIYGDLTLSSLNIDAVYVNFDTSSVECPISYKYQIVQESGTLKIDSKMKFLSGSSLTIAKGAKCIINAGTTFYQKYTPVVTYVSTDFSPLKMGRSKLVVNGALTINSSFGGVINTEGDGQVTTGTDFVGSYTSVEVIDCGGTSYATNYEQHLERAEAYMSDGTLKILSPLNDSETNYHLSGNYWTDSAADSKVTQATLGFSPAYAKSANQSTADYTVTVSCDYFTSYNIDAEYKWSIDNGLNLSENGNQVSFTTPKATSNEITYTLTCEVSFTSTDLGTHTITFTGQYIAYYSCVLPTALVLMADGTYKQAGSLNIGDEVLCFDHETGKMIPNKLIINSHINEEPRLYEVVNLEFENNKKTSLVDEHAYFDVEKNKYVYLNKDNATQYIGHRFVFVDHELKRYTLKLTQVTVEKIFTKLAAPVSAYHLNVIVDDMLSIEGGIAGLFNVFEYNLDTLAYDKELMEEDIKKYGLTDYGQFKDYFPYEIFHDYLPCKYFNVACGKGIVTWDIIKSYISKWKDQLMENMK